MTSGLQLAVDGLVRARSTLETLPAVAASSGVVAVVLAAGLGSRLHGVQADRPKGFVEVGGRPIIAHSVAALRRAGVTEFVFVVGWKKAAYETWCSVECPGAVCVERV